MNASSGYSGGCVWARLAIEYRFLGLLTELELHAICDRFVDVFDCWRRKVTFSTLHVVCPCGRQNRSRDFIVTCRLLARRSPSCSAIAPCSLPAPRPMKAVIGRAGRAGPDSGTRPAPATSTCRAPRQMRLGRRPLRAVPDDLAGPTDCAPSHSPRVEKTRVERS